MIYIRAGASSNRQEVAKIPHRSNMTNIREQMNLHNIEHIQTDRSIPKLDLPAEGTPREARWTATLVTAPPRKSASGRLS